MRRGIQILMTLAVLASLLTAGQAAAWAQPAVPGLSGPVAAKAEAEKEKGAGTTKEAPATTVATSTGPIKVDNTVDDHAVQETLETLLPKYPGVREVNASVNQGVVELDGLVDDDDTRNQMTNVAKQVKGVRMVVNRLATDAEVLTAPQLVMGQIMTIWDVVSRRWLLAVLCFL